MMTPVSIFLELLTNGIRLHSASVILMTSGKYRLNRLASPSVLEYFHKRMIQEGASSYYTQNVRFWLDGQFGLRYIVRGGGVPWPAQFPDLTSCDFSLSDFIK